MNEMTIKYVDEVWTAEFEGVSTPIEDDALPAVEALATGVAPSEASMGFLIEMISAKTGSMSIYNKAGKKVGSLVFMTAEEAMEDHLPSDTHYEGAEPPGWGDKDEKDKVLN